MKKYFSLASALMLALSMGMTSCSDDINEVQAPTEQQPETHILYLNATAPNTPETRAYVEGVEGKDDAFKITGWKNGDKLYGIYQNVTNFVYEEYIEGEPASVEFEFNGTEFVSKETTVTKEQILYFIHGNGSLGGNMDLNYMFGHWSVDFLFTPTKFASEVDVENNDTDILMFGNASVVGEKLTANMQLPTYMTFICLHNDSDSPITAKLINVIGSTDKYLSEFAMYVEYEGASVTVNRSSDSNAALTAEIPARGKAYLPTFRYTNTTKVEVNGTMVASKTGTVEGKVYKLTYPSAAFVAK